MAIIIFSFGFEGLGNTIYKPYSINQRSAAAKANIKLPDGKYKYSVIFKDNMVIEIKPFETKAWTAEMADDVIKHIIEAVRQPVYV